MRRKVIYKSFAIKAVAVIFALLVILSIFPLRVWQREIPMGKEVSVPTATEKVNDYHDVVQKIMTSYDRLSSIDIYVDKVEGGKYLSLVIYDENMQECYERFIYVGDVTEPGYVNVPLKLNVEVGKVYTFMIKGCFSTVYLGTCENNEETMPYLLDYAYHDTGVQGVHLLTGLNYEQPISKTMSLGLIVAIAAIAAVICIIVDVTNKPHLDKLVTVHSVIKCVGNPIVIILTLALMIMIFPLKIFDDRIIDIVFYEIGAVIAGLLMLYAINHENDATLDTKLWHNILNMLKMSALAGAFWFCCEYMNSLYTIYQTLAERKEVICLLIFLCLTLPRERVLKVYNLVYVIVAVICGTIYRNMHLIPDTEKEYDLNNAATLYGIIIVLLALFFLINLVLEIIKRKNKSYRLSPLGWMLIVFLAAIVIFRNTRWWGIILAVFVLALMACYSGIGFRRFEHKKGEIPEDTEKKGNGYIGIIIGGMMLNFVAEMIYSLLYRDFAAFNTGRFPFVFHTVTVTAEYMTVMVAASMSILLYKIYTTRNITTIKDRFRYMWKEFILFGLIASYMIFTMSRTAYFACGIMALFAFILSAGDNKTKKLKYFGRQLVTLMAAVVVVFPVAFTLQRTIPALVMRPQWFVVEPENVAMYGGAQPDSRLYMGVERFADLFAEKILGTDLLDYNYPQDRYNYDESGNPIYGETGVLLTAEQSENRVAGLSELIEDPGTSPETYEYLMESAGYELGLGSSADESTDESAEGQETTDDSGQEDGDFAESEGEDYTNGRIAIFKSYLEQMTFEGHDEMGAVLSDGEVAVHAHNTYLQVMYDNGIIAGVLFFIMMATSFISGVIFYNKKKDVEAGAMLPYNMTIGFGIAALSEWVFQLSNPMAIAFVLAIMPIAFMDRKR